MYRCLKQPLKLVPTLVKDVHIHRENSSECFLSKSFQNAKKGIISRACNLRWKDCEQKK